MLGTLGLTYYEDMNLIPYYFVIANLFLCKIFPCQLDFVSDLHYQILFFYYNGDMNDLVSIHYGL
jgi:hypothetical protein